MALTFGRVDYNMNLIAFGLDILGNANVAMVLVVQKIPSSIVVVVCILLLPVITK